MYWVVHQYKKDVWANLARKGIRLDQWLKRTSRFPLKEVGSRAEVAIDNRIAEAIPVRQLMKTSRLLLKPGERLHVFRGSRGIMGGSTVEGEKWINIPRGSGNSWRTPSLAHEIGHAESMAKRAPIAKRLAEQGGGLEPPEDIDRNIFRRVKVLYPRTSKMRSIVSEVQANRVGEDLYVRSGGNRQNYRRRLYPALLTHLISS